MDMKTIDDRTIFIQACGQVIRLPNQEDSVKPDDYLMVNVFKYILDYSSGETINTVYRANSNCYNALGMFEFRHLQDFSPYIHSILKEIFPKGGKC